MRSLLYKHAQNNSYQLLSFKSVEITDMKSIPIWISYHFQTYKQLGKTDQKARRLFTVPDLPVFISGFM